VVAVPVIPVIREAKTGESLESRLGGCSESGDRTIALQAGRQSDTLSQKKKKSWEVFCEWQRRQQRLNELEGKGQFKQTFLRDLYELTHFDPQHSSMSWMLLSFLILDKDDLLKTSSQEKDCVWVL
jgi:hypothetical protein